MCTSINGTTHGVDGEQFSVDASCAVVDPTSHVNVQAPRAGPGTLADQGGPTHTMALLPGSIANGGHVRAGTDQRGRPDRGATRLRRGAYECRPAQHDLRATTTRVARVRRRLQMSEPRVSFGTTSSFGLFTPPPAGDTSTQRRAPDAA